MAAAVLLMQVPVAEGQDVKQGALLAVIDPRPYQATLDTAMAKKQQDEAQLSNAQADLARYDSLVRRDFASRQQLDTQQAMVKQYTAAILGDDAQIEAARLNLSFCYITSPFDGRIGLRNVDPGNMVRSAELTPIISVTQIQPITVTFTLPQNTLPAIMQAMETHTLDVVAYDSDNKAELDRGVLLTPDNTIDTTTGTVKLRAQFDNQDNALFPNQFVNIELLVDTLKDAVIVPSAAIQRGSPGTFVYLIKDDNSVAVHPVKLGPAQGDNVAISDGLAVGDKIVIDGVDKLRDGSKITLPGDKPASDDKDPQHKKAH